MQGVGKLTLNVTSWQNVSVLPFDPTCACSVWCQIATMTKTKPLSTSLQKQISPAGDVPDYVHLLYTDYCFETIR